MDWVILGVSGRPQDISTTFNTTNCSSQERLGYFHSGDMKTCVDNDETTWKYLASPSTGTIEKERASREIRISRWMHATFVRASFSFVQSQSTWAREPRTSSTLGSGQSRIRALDSACGFVPGFDRGFVREAIKLWLFQQFGQRLYNGDFSTSLSALLIGRILEPILLNRWETEAVSRLVSVVRCMFLRSFHPTYVVYKNNSVHWIQDICPRNRQSQSITFFRVLPVSKQNVACCQLV